MPAGKELNFSEDSTDGNCGTKGLGNCRMSQWFDSVRIRQGGNERTKLKLCLLVGQGGAILHFVADPNPNPTNQGYIP